MARRTRQRSGVSSLCDGVETCADANGASSKMNCALNRLGLCELMKAIGEGFQFIVKNEAAEQVRRRENSRNRSTKWG